MRDLFLEFYDASVETDTLFAPLETSIVLFFHLCEERCADAIKINLIHSKQIKSKSIRLKLSLIKGDLVKNGSIWPANVCQLPVLVIDSHTCVAGICSVVRHLLKAVDVLHPWLGFKQSCLYACAESSLWTRFCEIDAVKAAYDILTISSSDEKVEVPKDIVRFEKHLEQPVRIHNIEKCKKEAATIELEHKFAEGPQISIADIILFPTFYITFKILPQVANNLPLIAEWLKHLNDFDTIRFASDLFQPLNEINCELFIPEVAQASLYKSDPKRYKPRAKIFTRYEDVEDSLNALAGVELIEISKPFGFEMSFDWESVPSGVHPDLPEKRFLRKSQQLENLAKAVLKLARNGDRIVDFCAGSGHLGLLLAHFLPRCRIILLENKEESLKRARQRANSLSISNISFIQSNVDYFKGDFDIGVSLHACGVATDLVLDLCVRKNAAFVSCPCCYGSLAENHVVQYPKSKSFKNVLTVRKYLVLAHAADQNFVNNKEKEEMEVRGSRCMDVVDSDRCLSAQEAGYRVYLSKLWPLSCTPKHNLLVGVPPNK